MFGGGSIGLIFKIQADSSGAQKALKAVRDDSAALDAEVKKLAKSLGILPSEAKALVAEFGHLSTDTDRVKVALDRLGAEGLNLVPTLERLAKQMKGVEAAEQQLGAQTKTLGNDFAKEIGGKLQGALQNAAQAGGPVFGTLADLASNFGGRLGLVAGGAAAVVGGITALALKTADYAREVANAAKVTGLSTDALQALDREARLAGQDLRGVVEAVAQFTGQIGDARSGNEELMRSFSRLGVNINDVFLTTEKALDQTLRKLAQMPASIEKTTIANRLFGEEGARLALSLGDTGNGLTSLVEKYKRMGVVLDRDAIRKSQEFNKSLGQLKLNVAALSQSIGEIGIPILNEYAKAFNEVIKAFQKGYAIYPRLLRLFKETPLLAAPELPVPSLPPNFLELLNGPKTTKKPGGGGSSDLTELELQLNRLRRATEDAREAFDVEIEAIRESFRRGQLTGEEYFQAIVAAEESFIRNQQLFAAEERKLIEKSNHPRRRKIEELEQLAAREAKILNESTKRIVAADQEVLAAQLKSIEDRAKAEVDHRRRLEQIAQVADDREIARLRAQAEQRIISFEAAEKKIAAIQRRAIDRRLGEIDTQFLTTNDLTEQQRLGDEYAILLEERAKATEDSTGRIITARDKDAEALRKLRDVQKKLLDELRREEQEAANERVNNLVDRAQTDPRFQLQAVQAVTEARRQAAIEENRLNLQRIEADEEAAIATARNARASAAEIEQIEADSLARRLNEQRRFVEEMSGINRQGGQQGNAADPGSNFSIFGVDLNGEQSRFGAFGSAVQGALGDLSASMGNFRDLARSVFSTIAQGAQASLSAFILTGKAGGLAFKKLAADVIAAVAVQSAVKAIFELAEGFAALARYDFASATNHFAAAKIYGLTAAAAGAVGAAIGAAGGLGGGAAAGAGGFGGGGSFGSSPQPTQINLNRGGDGERLGVGQAGVDLIAGGIFGQLIVAVQQQSQATAQLAARIDSIPEGEIIRRGAPQATDAIGQAVVTESRRSAEFVNEFGRILMGPA